MYRYRKLKNPETDLRLVQILPGTDGDPLNCLICTRSARRIKRYYALSYAWGNATQRVPILLNGRKIYITINLFTALANLRTPEKAKICLWIDALCIDQENIHERDQQVLRMRSIYAMAYRVIVWLGDYNEPGDVDVSASFERWGLSALQTQDDRTTLKLLETIRTFSELNFFKNYNGLSQDWFNTYEQEALQDLIPLAKLFHRPWFKRLWIIQELYSAREVVLVYGKSQYKWPSFSNAAQFILNPGKILNFLPETFRRAFPLMGAHHMTQVAIGNATELDRDNILTALRLTQDAKCSDPRDRLYALLGIVTDVKDVSIDYGCDVESVYRNWAKRRILRTRSLDILSACTDSGKEGTFPSWVPDLRQSFAQDKVLWIQSHLSEKCHTDPQWLIPKWSKNSFNKPSRDCYVFSKQDLHLETEGHTLASIRALSTIANATTTLKDIIEMPVKLKQILMDWEDWIISQDMEGAISHVRRLTNALARDGSENNIPTYRGPSLQLFDQYRKWRGIGEYKPQEGRNEGDFSRLETHLFQMVHGCQLMATANREYFSQPSALGVVAGNCNAQIGDEVWYLRGGLTPFIVRLNPDMHTYRLVGPCFLDTSYGRHQPREQPQIQNIILA